LGRGGGKKSTRLESTGKKKKFGKTPTNNTTGSFLTPYGVCEGAEYKKGAPAKDERKKVFVGGVQKKTESNRRFFGTTGKSSPRSAQQLVGGARKL